jgi:hypothetical protein
MKNLPLTVASIAFALCSVSARAQSPAGTCLPASDSISARMLRFLDSLVVASTTSRQELRHKLGVSAATIPQITPVTVDSVCTRAAVALNTIARVKRSSIPLYVATVGSAFAVADTAAHISGGTPLWFFDGSWHYIALLQYF